MKINPRSKNIEAIKSLKQDIKEKEIETILNDNKILISISNYEDISDNEKEIILVLINLLPRIFNRVYILNGKKFVEEFPKSHQKKIRIVSHLQDPEINIIVGNFENEIGNNKIYVNSSGWSAYVSRKSACKFSKYSNNPIGAILAGALCVGEVFKTIFKSHLNVQIEETMIYDPITHGKSHQPVIQPDISKTIQINDITLVGLGGVGQGVMYCIRKLPISTKTLILIDKDKTDESNEQRYVLSFRENRNQPKINIARDHVLNKLKIGNLNSYQLRYEEFVPITQLLRPRLSNVIVSVDNIETRKNLQAGLPKRIINGWTETDNQNLAYGVSVHEFSTNYECLACAYFPEKGPEDQIEFYSIRTGFPVEEVKRRINQNIPLTEDDIDHISSHLNIKREPVKQYVGKQLEDVIHGQCGTFTIPMKQKEATAPVPHIPLLVAIHLTTQLLLPYLEKYKKSIPIISSAVFYGLRNPNSDCIEIRLKNEKCFCNDQIYLEIYKEKWKNE